MWKHKSFSHPWEELLRWRATAGELVIDFGAHEEGHLTVETSDGEEIAALMTAHADQVAGGRAHQGSKSEAETPKSTPKSELAADGDSDDGGGEKCEDSYDEQLAGDDVPDCPFNVAQHLLQMFDKDQVTCAICRNPMFTVEEETIIVEGSPCIECQAIPRSGECPISVGTCKHVFHFHCICRWRRTRTACPLDNMEWHTAARGTEMNETRS